MAVTGFFYGNAFVAAFNGGINITGDVKVALLGSGHVPSQDTHTHLDDVIANEASGVGYTAGGQSLTTVSVAYNGATNVFSMDADPASWPSSNITARYAVVFVDTGVDATSPLIGLVDFGVDVSSTGGAFTITWDAAGIATITVA